MDNIEKLFESLKSDETKALFREIPKPKNPEEYVRILLGIAEKQNISVTPEELDKALKEKEQEQMKATAAAEEQVKVSLDENALNMVAGGDGRHADCQDTWGAEDGEDENCWFNDKCNYVWNSYQEGTLPICVYTEVANEDTIMNGQNEHYHTIDDFDIF